MKTLVRALIYLFVALWLGAVMFFPFVAYYAFTTISDTHIAGTIVRKSLITLHYEGLFAGTMIVILLLVAQSIKALPRNVIAPVAVTVVMLALTAFSQFSIIPRMERYRLAAGGAIDAVGLDDPNHVAFNRLHNASTTVEKGVLAAGIVLVVFLAANVSKERA